MTGEQQSSPRKHGEGERARSGCFGRLFRAGVIGLAVLLLLAGFACWIVTRSWFIIGRVEPELAKRLGGEVQIGYARYEGGGKFTFSDLTLTARGFDAEAGRVASIGRAVVIVDEGDLLGGTLRLTEVELRDVELRLSEDSRAAGEFNFMALRPEWPREEDTPLQLPPRIVIRDVLLEHGQHDDEGYRPLGQRRMAGQMFPSPDTESWFEVELGEIDEREVGFVEEGLLLHGTWNAATNEFESRLDGLRLDEKTYQMCPKVVRLWWDQMNLQGRVGDVTVRHLGEDPLSLEFKAEDVALTIPVDTAEVWARYRHGRIEPESGRPRMRVNRGTIRLGLKPDGGSWLQLDDLQGVLGSADESDDLISVPYRMTLDVPSLPPLTKENQQQWKEKVLAAAPFTADFRMDDFRLREGARRPAPAVELPLVVAQIMERFALTSWRLSTQVKLQRAEPTIDEEGSAVAQPIRSLGRADISEAAGAYYKFPYPLKNVRAWVEFDDEKARIESLVGTGAGDAVIWLSGVVESLSMHPAIALTVAAADVPLDDDLRAALKPNVAAIFDALLHEPSFEGLQQAHLLPDAEAVNAAESELRRLHQELASLKAGDSEADAARQEEIDRIEASMDGLRRRVENGPFVLGGTVDLNLKIERAAGRGEPTITRGRIDLHRIGAVYDRFPYPFWIAGGSVEFERDRIRILSETEEGGIPVITPGGGRGVVKGEVAILKAGGRQRLLPDLSIAVAGDEASDLLYAAIPLSRHERARLPEEVRWPGGILSSGARLLRDVSLEGELQSFGSITTGAEGRVEYDIAFGLDDARAAPTESLSRAIGATGLLWPEGFSIEHVKSLLRVRRDAVELIEFAGRHDNGDVVATGRVDLAGEVADITLDVSFGDLALGEYLVNLLPSERLERGRELWNRYEPTGSFDAALHYHAAGETVDPPVLVVQPHELTVRLDERGATIAYAGGDLCLSAGQVEFRDLEVNLQCDDEDNGTLRIDGSYGVADESGAAGDQLHLTGEWQGGRFESPLVLEALHLFDAQRQAQRYLEYGFAGVFNAEFDYSSAGEDRPRNFELSIHPRTVSVSLNDTDLSVELDRSSNIRFVPGLIELSNVTGRLAEDPFTLNGTIRPGERPDLDFLFDYKGYLHGAHVQALLPGPVRAVLEAIEFDEGLPTRLADCRLRLVGVETGVASSQAESGSPWGNWLIDFRGTMLTKRASLKAGVEIKEMDGAIDIELHHRPSLTPQLSMEVQIDRMDVLGITFTDARASIFLNEDGTRILMPDLQAKTHDGKATAEAIAGVGEQKDYRAEIDLVGVELGGLLAGLNGSPAESNRAPDAEGGTHGELWASLTVAGRRDEPQSRVGRGELRLLGGQVAAIPLALRLVQVLQLSAPLGQGLDYAESEFFITGDKLVFNRILFESTVMDSIAALQLRGEGELDLNSQQLNTRFRSRGGLLLVRDVLGGIGDQLYVIEVSGPLSDPKASIVPLPGLSR